MLTQENKIPIKSYEWFYEDINDLYLNLENKTNIANAFCHFNDYIFEKEIGYNLELNSWYIKINLYSI